MRKIRIRFGRRNGGRPIPLPICRCTTSQVEAAANLLGAALHVSHPECDLIMYRKVLKQDEKRPAFQEDRNGLRAWAKSGFRFSSNQYR
jgi:hypothetical protein